MFVLSSVTFFWKQIECQYSVTLRLLQHNNIPSITSGHIRMSTFSFLSPNLLLPSQRSSCRTCPCRWPRICSSLRSFPWLWWCAFQRCGPFRVAQVLKVQRWHVPMLCGLVPHLRLPLEGLLQLQVLSCLARQIHPFAFEPLDSRFAEKIFGLHFGNEGDVSTFDTHWKHSLGMSSCFWTTVQI